MQRTSITRNLAVILVSVAAAALVANRLSADEGMIPISELPRIGLQAKGLKITEKEIADPEAPCLLDGIVRVNGCTGSFVSADGLIITNHHCAYGAIQSSSSPAHDYLKDGFQAKTRADEIPAKSYTVRITEETRDISSDVLSAVKSEMSFLDRTKAIDRRRKELEKAAEAAHPGLRAEVAEMFSGKTYWLFLYTYIKDVRLVFAPPASVGNFGGEIDNWEWPRHTGDFSFMRAYVAPDGSSAEYSPNNVPYKPKKFIQVEPKGVDEGDFVFILGYPGKTSRHRTASFLKYEQNVRLPYVAELYAWQMAVMEAEGKKDRAVELKHAAHFRSLANVEKRSRGQLKGLKRKPIIDAREGEELKLVEYIQADKARAAKYGSALSEIDAVTSEMSAAALFELNFENLRSASRALSIAYTLVDAAVEREKDDLEREPPYMDRNFDQTKKTLMLTVDDLHLPTDKVLALGMLKRLGRIPAATQVPALADLVRDEAGMERAVEQAVSTTRLGDPKFVEACLKMKPQELLDTEDPLIRFMAACYPKILELRALNKERTGRLDKAYGLLLEVKEEFQKQNFVPDANATLRITYGRVRSYSPEDGIIKTPITTLKGVIDKTTGSEPFDTPEKVTEAYKAGDFGPFVHPRLNQVPVAILYDTDTTGGNSGSPVLNAHGRLIAVNFDRAFEATINDFAWNTDYSRSIGVDIRYCLWITGKVYGAGHLLKEMGVSDR
ncbi:MAG: S46 family peptidase [Pirellulales bacterium]